MERDSLSAATNNQIFFTPVMLVPSPIFYLFWNVSICAISGMFAQKRQCYLHRYNWDCLNLSNYITTFVSKLVQYIFFLLEALNYGRILMIQKRPNI